MASAASLEHQQYKNQNRRLPRRTLWYPAPFGVLKMLCPQASRVGSVTKGTFEGDGLPRDANQLSLEGAEYHQ
jgi:hypothetical protein